MLAAIAITSLNRLSSFIHAQIALQYFSASFDEGCNLLGRFAAKYDISKII